MAPLYVNAGRVLPSHQDVMLDLGVRIGEEPGQPQVLVVMSLQFAVALWESLGAALEDIRVALAPEPTDIELMQLRSQAENLRQMLGPIAAA